MTAHGGPPPDDTVFTTARLVVRRWRDDDLPALLAVYGDAEAMRWVGNGQPLGREGCVQWLDVTRRNYALRGYGMFAVDERDAPAGAGAAGFCGIVHPGGQPEAEVKYAYRRSHWGRGLATEALRGLVDHAQKVLGLRELIATAAPDNAASHHVLRKAGLRMADRRVNDDGSLTCVFRWRAAE